MAQTTKKQFDLFTREAIYWIEKLSLKNWEVVFIHQEVDDGNRAWVEPDIVNKIIVMGLGVDWDWIEPTDFDIAKAAFHECCEIMLLKIDNKLNTFYSEEIVNELRHEIVRSLENSLFNDYWEKNKKRRK